MELDNLDILYLRLDNLNQAVFNNMEVIEVNNKIEYIAKLNESGFICLSQSDTKDISENDNCVLYVQLDKSFLNKNYNGFSVLLYITSNSNVLENYDYLSTNEYESKFEKVYHLLPVIGKIGLYKINLKNTIWKELNKTRENKFYYIFKIIKNDNSGAIGEIHQYLENKKPLSISLYKTNEKYYENNEIDILYSMLNKLREVIQNDKKE